jgi:hypothetical protein
MCAEIRTGELLAEIKKRRTGCPRGRNRRQNEPEQGIRCCYSANQLAPCPFRAGYFFVDCATQECWVIIKGSGGDAYLAAERPVERYDHRYQKRERGCDDAGHRQVHAEG